MRTRLLRRFAIPLIFKVIRWSKKPIRMGGMTFVAHASDVAEVLGDRKRFTVPFTAEMQAMAPPVTFALGRDDEEHDFQREVMEHVLHRSDLEGIRQVADEVATALITDARGEIDAMSDYVQRILTEVCFQYFGISHRDPDAFAQWNHSVSTVLFGDINGSSRERLDSTFEGARRLGACIDDAIRSFDGKAGNDRTLLGRMIDLRNNAQVLPQTGLSSDRLSDDTMRAILFGMSSGMIPTTQIACGHIFEVLRARKGIWADLAKAARSANRAEVQRIVMELARLRPTGFPGHVRFVPERCTLENTEGTSATFEAGTTIMACTAGALRDPANRPDPLAFRPDSPPTTNFMFGAEAIGSNPPIAAHSCVGKHVAIVVMTSAFLHLFAQPALRPKRRRQFVEFHAIIPTSYPVVFDAGPRGRGQTMVTVAIPVAPERTDAVRSLLEAEFTNPASGDSRAAFDAVETIHTASMTLANLSAKGKDRPTLLLELNGDGEEADVLDAVSGGEAAEVLRPLLTACGLITGVSIRRFLDRHVLRLKARPSRTMGLTFNGVPQFSTAQIDEERALASHCQTRLEVLRKAPETAGGTALDYLDLIRDELRREIRAPRLPESGAETLEHRLAPMLYRSPRYKDPLGGHVERSFLSAVGYWVATFAVPAGVLLLAVVGGLGWLSAGGNDISTLLVHGLVLFALLGAIGAALAWSLVKAFKAMERREVEDLDHPTLEQMGMVDGQENVPGVLQNHITAVNQLKPHPLRRLALGLGLGVIAAEVRHWFRPGFVLTIGTIRHAKWFRVPGTDQLVFQASYDGSWESYLEDFSNKAFEGQNAIWSNCEGFPATKGLIGAGAHDSDRFKRWVRSRQIRVPFWYSRYDGMTNMEMRRNALIRDGFARAKTPTEADAWLSYFGSWPPPADVLQTEEVQTVVFRGFGKLAASATIGLRLPDTDPAEARATLARLAERVRFGDITWDTRSLSLALTAEGLRKLGAFDPDAPFARRGFPPAFVEGMARRSRILGDLRRNHPEGWDWADAPAAGSKSKGVDLLAMLHAVDETALAVQIDWLHSSAGAQTDIVFCVRSQGAEGTPDAHRDIEPFGFLDGISQPAIKGSRRAMTERDINSVLNPGEFVLGYPNGKEVFPVTPLIDATRDLSGDLPSPPEFATARFTDFSQPLPDLKDLGRNGSFLVLRQLAQDVEGFWAAMEAAAAEFNALAPDHEPPATADWIAAKLIGRWKNGTSLVTYPDREPVLATHRMPDTEPHTDHGERPDARTDHDRAVYAPKGRDNGFRFGRDDPQGQRCPFGAHIRRANPRDALDPKSQEQVEISDRHRILRRGRPYASVERDGAARAEQGLMFVAVNANIERQFELIQQTWFNAPGFHGLTGERAPLLHDDDETAFTIPTPNGPVRLSSLRSYVQCQGGGYFFLPSRAALRFLTR
ncbi:MAG: hypothetical protein AAGK98_17565 [Pseudomonadota bacterium]